MNSSPARGRGATFDPPNRFEYLYLSEDDPDAMEYRDPDGEGDETGLRTVLTQVYREQARQIITRNTSPDIGFETSINPYRGCEHGCIYCYARQTHEYLGFTSGIEFETRIVVKENAAQALRKELSARSWVPQTISISGVTDPYQPLERKLGITRACLEVLAEFRNPAGIVTKNALVLRDLDILAEMAKWNGVRVCISVTTLDTQLAARMEPRAATPARRLDAIRRLNEAGVPTGVLVCPVIPGLTDAHLPQVLAAAGEAGARFAGYNIIALPYANRDLFEAWLKEHYPDKVSKVLNRIREIRGGKLYDADFGQRMTGQGIQAEHVRRLFDISRRRAGIPARGPAISCEHFRLPPGPQLGLFDDL